MDKLSKQITGVVVVYNTEKLFKSAYESVRRNIPNMRIVIVDGSDTSNSCFKYTTELKANPLNKVIQLQYNVGHGRGMCIGIYYVETPYFLLFDSDIVMVKNPLEEMNALMEENIFGVGKVQNTGYDGNDYHVAKGSVPYLHPFFALIQLRIYKKFHPFVHHGAPCIFTMLDIYRKGMSDTILKPFDLSTKIKHNFGGTRNLIRGRCNFEIEGVWETDRGQV
jgi:GT2 family glycosyltransferase